MRFSYRRILTTAVISGTLLTLGGCKPQQLPVAAQTPPPTVTALPKATTQPQASAQPQVYSGIDPATHQLPAPDRMLVIAKDWRAELIPGSRTYQQILELSDQRIQHDLTLTHIAVAEDDPQMEAALSGATFLVFEYDYRQDVSYSIGGFNMSMRFVRLLMPLQEVDGIAQAQELLYSGDEQAYFSEPVRIDPPQDALMEAIATLGGSMEAAQ